MPEEQMNIVLCVNSNYVMPTAVCMASIHANIGAQVHFFLFHSGLNNDEMHALEKSAGWIGVGECPVTFVHVPPDAFGSLPVFGRAKEAYFRLLIPQLLPSNLERCLYLDGDTLVLKSLDEFYRTPFDGGALVVTQDLGEQVFFHKERHPVLSIPPQYGYFNSGVLLWNLEWFRERGGSEVFFEWIKKNSSPEKLKFLDQDVLNAVLYNEVKYRDGYLNNYQEILINHALVDESLHGVAIVHFLSKPWKYGYSGMNAKYWWKYGSQLYPSSYVVFVVVNFLYRKALGILLLFFSVRTLKKVNFTFKKMFRYL